MINLNIVNYYLIIEYQIYEYNYAIKIIFQVKLNDLFLKIFDYLIYYNQDINNVIVFQLN